MNLRLLGGSWDFETEVISTLIAVISLYLYNFLTAYNPGFCVP